MTAFPFNSNHGSGTSWRSLAFYFSVLSDTVKTNAQRFSKKERVSNGASYRIMYLSRQGIKQYSAKGGSVDTWAKTVYNLN